MVDRPQTQPNHPEPPTLRSDDATTDMEGLAQLLRRLAVLSTDRSELSKRAERLAARIATQQFHIAVLGEFKRGKSTLVNALIGRPLLPSGVVPLTAVTTEVHFGTAHTAVIFDDGHQERIDPDAIDGFVTERGNPSNSKRVQRVEVGINTVWAAPGVVLVDTPGIASVYASNTAAAHAALTDSDAAVVVLSADNPLSLGELGLLTELHERRAKVFTVINKADHLGTDDELSEVRAFVTEHLHQLGHGENIHPYCVSARSALDAKTERRPLPPGFSELQNALERFIRQHLAPARRASTIAELSRLATSLDHTLRVAAAAEAMDEHTLTTQLLRFDAAVQNSRRQLHDDRVILDHDVAALASDMGGRLSALAAAQGQSCQPSVVSAVRELPRRQLDTGLRETIEDCVRRGFEPIRRAVQSDLETAWEEVASRFAGRVQARVGEVIGVANHLFDIHLPSAPIPTVTSQRERFMYLFVYIGGYDTISGRLSAAVLPAGIVRRRAQRRAVRRLLDEFNKHAGRARHDLADRLESTKRQFAAALMDDFDRTEASLAGAAHGARALLALSESERRQRDDARGELDAVLRRVNRVVTEEAVRSGPDPSPVTSAARQP